MSSVICVHFSQLIDHCVTEAYTHTLNTIEHTHAKIISKAHVNIECHVVALMVKLLIISVT